MNSVKIMILASAASIAYLTTSPTAVAGFGHCKYSNEIERTVDVDKIKFLNVVAGAGGLKIIGEDRDNIEIEAKLCSNDKDALKEMTVSDKLKGNEITIETEFPGDSSWLNDNQMSIDLVLTVPNEMILDVKDSSGSAEIENVTALEIIDSSGELEIEDIAGDVTVVDSSGAMSIENIGGNVTITDSSGGIEVNMVEKNVTVEVDSSGAIETTHVKGNVLIKVDSSGSITAANVGGDFTVGKDSSGGIEYNKVNGKVNLPN